MRNLSVEGLLSLEPTVNIGEDDVGPLTVLQQLENARVETFRVPEQHNAEGVIAKVQCVADLLNVPSQKRQETIGKLRQLVLELEEISTTIENDIRVAVLLSLSGSSPLTAGDNTSGGGFLCMVKVNNVFC